MINRRLFLRRATQTALAGAVFPSIAPGSVFGAEGQPSPNSRVAVGCIGTGEQGRGVMHGFLNNPLARVTAVCDVSQSQRELAQQAVNAAYQNQNCALYDDFRALLDRKDIDAVLIATPDHWHVPAALAAVRAGKDVYLEKRVRPKPPTGRQLDRGLRPSRPALSPERSGHAPPPQTDLRFPNRTVPQG